MPLAVASALIPPLGMTLFLVVLSMAVTQQPVAFVTEAHGPQAQKMAKIIRDDTDAYLLTSTDATTARQLLASQQVVAVITIPTDFDANVARRAARVDLTINNIDIDFSDDIRRSVDRSVAQFDAPQLSLAGEHEDDAHDAGIADAVKANSYRMTIAEQDLRETNVKWLNYQVIPAIILLILSVGLMGTALLCAQDIERKTARYLAVSPQQSWILVAGRILGGVVACLIVLIPAIIVCALLHIIAPPLSHWPALAAIFLATALCASGLGAILGTVLRGSRAIAMASSVLATCMFFLGGGFTTIAFLPEWLRTVSAFIPIRYAIDGLRQALFYTTLDGVPLDLAVLCATALIAVVIGSYCVRSSWIT